MEIFSSLLNDEQRCNIESLEK